MNFLKVILDPAILVIIATFSFTMSYCAKKYLYVNKNLSSIINFLQDFKKTNLVYRFNELNNEMTNNPYTTNIWAEFKNTLIFSEKLNLKQKDNLKFENISTQITNIQTTIDPIYFFNEETLVQSKYNSNFLQAAPTLLTGLGPLFTFLNIAIAFSHIDFSTSESTISSISNLMSSMQVAALCSVLAVGFSLIFLLAEKLLYNNKCKLPLGICQQILSELFDSISSEKFLIELLKETKSQNNVISNLMSELPNQFKSALDKSLNSTLVPYLESLVFGMNKMKDGFKAAGNGSKKDIVDDLF